MVLGTAGPMAVQKSAPNSAQHCSYGKLQAMTHHAYWRTTYPGKKSIA